MNPSYGHFLIVITIATNWICGESGGLDAFWKVLEKFGESVPHLNHHADVLETIGELEPHGLFYVERPAATDNGAAYHPFDDGRSSASRTMMRAAGPTSFVQLNGAAEASEAKEVVEKPSAYLRRDTVDTQRAVPGKGLDADHVALHAVRRLHKQRRQHQVLGGGNASLLQADAVAQMRTSSSSSQAPSDEIVWSGKVQVARDVKTDSELVKLEANVNECLMGQTLPDCWQKYGSYGIRRLYAEEYEDILYEGLVRPDWMEHPNVQKSKLFSLTLPGSHHSGAYTVQGEHEDRVNNGYGVLTQNLNIAQQLEVGIRFFQFGIAWAIKAKRLYVSHGYLTIPLKVALQAINTFLKRHTSEVVVISLRKDMSILDYNSDVEYLKVLQDEEKDPYRIPGQTVHTEVMAVLGKLVATYERLLELPPDESLENPSVAICQELDMRVFYFYEGQQVLCPDHDACEKTPGWTVNQDSRALPFGPPLKMGQRQEAEDGVSSQKVRVIEPGCIFHSATVQPQDKPDQAAKSTKLFTEKMQDFAKLRLPKCFHERSTPPSAAGEPPLFYVADAVVTRSKAKIIEEQEALKHSEYIFTRGEGFSVRSEAERVNFLVLANLLKPGFQNLVKNPNAIVFDFAAPILISRMIDAEQGRKDCGWAVYCKHSGSCWSRSLLRPVVESDQGSSDSCYEEEYMETWIRETVEGRSFANMWILHCVLLAYIFCLCGYWKGCLWMCFKSVDRPAQNLGCLGVPVFASLGAASDEKTAAEGPAAPKLLHVEGTGEDGYDGNYELVEGKLPNGMPLWKWQEGDGNAWIFSGTSGQWFFGDEDEEGLNFDCSLGNFCSESPHCGTFPHQLGEGSWMKFDFSGKEWVKEPALLIQEPES